MTITDRDLRYSVISCLVLHVINVFRESLLAGNPSEIALHPEKSVSQPKWGKVLLLETLWLKQPVKTYILFAEGCKRPSAQIAVPRIKSFFESPKFISNLLKCIGISLPYPTWILS